MARDQRIDPEVESLWEEFHAQVNVTSEQLRSWLLTRGSGEEAFAAAPDLDLPEPGRQILAVLGKRKVDLTPADIDVMSGNPMDPAKTPDVVEQVSATALAHVRDPRVAPRLGVLRRADT